MTQINRFAVVLEHPQGASNWSGYVPDLPGCVSTGKNREECLSSLREAIEFHLEGMREDGLEIPIPTTDFEYVDVA